MMKKFYVIFLLLFSFQAWAGNWIQYGDIPSTGLSVPRANELEAQCLLTSTLCADATGMEMRTLHGTIVYSDPVTYTLDIDATKASLLSAQNTSAAGVIELRNARLSNLNTLSSQISGASDLSALKTALQSLLVDLYTEAERGF